MPDIDGVGGHGRLLINLGALGPPRLITLRVPLLHEAGHLCGWQIAIDAGHLFTTAQDSPAYFVVLEAMEG